MNQRRGILSVAAALLAAAISTIGISPQSAYAAGTGGIEGTIVDEDGAPVAGARVDLVVDGTGSSTAASDSDGAFSFTELDAGEYQLHITGVAMADRDYPDDGGTLTVTDGAITTAAVAVLRFASIEGTVFDSDANPVGGARLRISGGVNNTDEQTVADANGTYRFNHILSGDYAIEATADGFGTATIWTGLSGGEERTGADLTIAALGSISGTVTGDSQPLEGIEVHVRPYYLESWFTTRTAADGSYTVGVPAGTWLVEFADPTGHFAPEIYDSVYASGNAQPVELGIGQTITGIDADLDRPASIGGIVTDAGGDPVVGATVYMSGATPTTTDAAGYYSFENLTPSDHDASFFYADSDRVEEVIHLTSGEHRTHNVTLPLSLGSLTGILSDASGNPLGGIDVVVSDFTGRQWIATTGNDGRYTLPRLVRVTYYVRVTADGAQPIWFSTLLEPETTTNLDLTLAFFGSLSGRVTSAGQPVEGVTVTATSADTFASYSAVSDGSGGYRFDQMLPGSYVVAFSPPSDQLLLEYYDNAAEYGDATPVVVTEHTSTPGIDADLAAAGSISGRVTDPAGQPIPWLTIYALTPAGQTLWGYTDGDGHYRFGGMAAGAYSLTFSRWDLQTAQESVFLAAGEDATRDVTMRSSFGQVRLHLVDSDGGAIPGASASAFGPGGAYSGTSDDTGIVTLDGMTGGDYQVSVFADGFIDLGTDVVVVAETTADYDIVMQRYGSIAGHVTSGGTPANGVSILVTNGFDRFDATTDDHGDYRVDQVTAGEWTVQFFDAAGRMAGEFFDDVPTSDAATPVVVSQGAVASGVNADLTPFGVIEGTVVGDDGMPLFAQVIVVGPTSSSAWTDATGHYRLDSLVPGRYTVRFEAADYDAVVFDGAAAIDISGAVITTLDATLPRAVAELAGTVTDGAGNLLANAEIDLYGPTSRYILSDENGRYTFADLPSGDYQLRIFATGYLDQNVNLTVVAGQVNTLDVVMIAASSLTGVIRDSTGSPVEGATVTTRVYAPGVSETRQTTTDAEGRYLEFQLPAGYLSIEAGGPGYALAQLGYRPIAEGETLTINGTLHRAGQVSGRVIDDLGNPVTTANIARPYGSSVTQGADGSYTMTGLNPGFVLLYATAPGHILRSNWVTITEGQALTGVDIVMVRLGSITGQVVDADGNGVGGLAVTWVGLPSRNETGPVATDDQGRFVLAGVTGEGNVRLANAAFGTQLFDGDGVVGADHIVVANGEGRDIGVHVAAAAGAISGWVTKHGTAVGGVTVSAYAVDIPGPPVTAVTADDGSYRVGSLAVGHYTVYFAANDADHVGEYWSNDPLGIAGQTVAVASAHDTVGIDADLDRSSAIEGTVTGPDGSPIAGATVSVSTPRPVGFGLPGRSEGYTTTDDQGHYVITGLTRGDWQVFVAPADGLLKLHRSTAALTDGATTVHGVTLDLGGILVVEAPVGGLSLDAAICLTPANPVVIADGRLACSDPAATAVGRYDFSAYPASMRLNSMAPGTYRFMIKSGDGTARSSSPTFTIRAGETTTCAVRFDTSTTCDNTVLDDTDPPIVTCGPRPVFTLAETGAVVRGSASDDGATWEVSAAAVTTAVGTHRVDLATTDAAGNTGTEGCEYDVHYRFSGFASPISDILVNRVKSEAFVQMVWKLYDATGHRVGDLGTVTSVTTMSHPCVASARTKSVASSGREQLGLRLVSPGKYRYVWHAGRSMLGCVTVTVALDDGTTHAAEFLIG